MTHTVRVAIIGVPVRVDGAFDSNARHIMGSSGGNTGNFAYVGAIQQHVLPHPGMMLCDPAVAKEFYDIVVVPCANQLGPHCDMGDAAKLLEKINLPIVAIGLGAQSFKPEGAVELTPGTRRWIDVIADHAPSKHANIGMRGEFSFGVLEKLGLGSKCAITGCPSNLTNMNTNLSGKIVEKIAKQTIRRVAVPAGLHLWPPLAGIEQLLAKIVTDTEGAYIAQSEIDMIRLARDEVMDIDPETLEKHRAYIAPEKNMGDFLLWTRRFADHFVDAPSWIHAMRKFDFVAGPRFHGVMMGIQAGVPGGVIAHDSRTMEMCQTMGLPVRHYTDMPAHFTAVDLIELFPFDPAFYDKQRSKLAKAYTGILRAAGVGYNPRLDVIAKDVSVQAAA
jgi:hypothetical protein